jgi:hypothetical protein
MVALLSMMAKSGKLSYRDLIGALVAKDAKGVPRRLTASSLLKITNLGYIESLIGSIVRGKELPRASKEIVDFEETFFKNEVFKKLVNYLNIWDDRKIQPLSEQLICALLPNVIVPNGPMPCADSLFAITSLSKERDEVEQTIWLIYRLFFINLKLGLKEDIEKIREGCKTTLRITPDPVKYPKMKKRYTNVVLPTYSTTIET